MSDGTAHTVWTQGTPFVPLTITASQAGVRSVEFSTGAPVGGHSDADVAGAFASYFDGDLHALDGVPVDLEGLPPFRRSVLDALRAVRPRELTSYGALAAAAGRPGAARAVGQAVGSNPVPVIVPCHRVVAADGTLGGFSAGLGVKRWLLAHEGVAELSGGWPARRAARLPESLPG